MTERHDLDETGCTFPSGIHKYEGGSTCVRCGASSPAVLPEPSTSSTAIVPRDFSSRTTDPLRDSWTTGKLRHVVRALDGARVAIVVDCATGHAEIGVRLLGVHYDRGDQRCTIERKLSDGTMQRTHFRADNLGAIIPLDQESAVRGAKWAALDSYRDECSRAIAKVRAEHGEPEGRAWGRWEATPVATDSVNVSYEPLTGNPAFAGQWGTSGVWQVSTRDLVNVNV